MTRRKWWEHRWAGRLHPFAGVVPSMLTGVPASQVRCVFCVDSAGTEGPLSEAFTGQDGKPFRLCVDHEFIARRIFLPAVPGQVKPSVSAVYVDDYVREATRDVARPWWITRHTYERMERRAVTLLQTLALENVLNLPTSIYK